MPEPAAGRKLNNGPLFDRTILLVTFALLGISLVIISSASVQESLMLTGDSMYYFKRQIAYIVLGLLTGVISAAVPCHIWLRYSVFLLAAALSLLVAVLAVGTEVNEARRWINLGFFNIQPAEICKLCWIIYFAGYLSRKLDMVLKSWRGFFKTFFIPCIIAYLLLQQPDFGSLFVLFVISLGMLFIAGAKIYNYVVLVCMAGIFGAYNVISSPYRMERIMSFWNPWEDQYGTGYQLTQSLMAFGRGGLYGEGIGNSMQKMGYLPEAHTDFIMAILGEETGFIGVCLVMLLELILVYKALHLSTTLLRRQVLFEGFMACGIGIWLMLQTFVNLGVAIGAVPTKGLTLPLVSYGGSSLMVSMAAIAILLRIDFAFRHNSPELSSQREKAGAMMNYNS